MSTSVSDAATNPKSIYGSRKAALALVVIVVGCGILSHPGRPPRDHRRVLSHDGARNRRGHPEERISFTKWEGVAEKEHGAPYYQVHRADLHKILHDLVAPRVTILLNSVVVGCDLSGPLYPNNYQCTEPTPQSTH
ncbi:hypothetical protein BJ322DRAFT_1016877 [Thelephora terrestris]|uniref:Uncharacterized protein n=1 Tax=Thelephora terrestris TaxID=56493 RepID=A0A9P6HS69_9AGAM|nr:hypothetical protein BJ322DRAFT_1016877 [Thelephora terrestris]